MPNTQETSHHAYFTEVLPNLADRHRKVLEVLSTVPDATNNELKIMLGWEINCVTGRTNELAFPKDENKKPLIEAAYKRPCKITGRTAIAWRVIRKAQKDPSMFRCQYCNKTAVAFKGELKVCADHSKEKAVAPSLF